MHARAIPLIPHGVRKEAGPIGGQDWVDRTYNRFVSVISQLFGLISRDLLRPAPVTSETTIQTSEGDLIRRFCASHTNDAARRL